MKKFFSIYMVVTLMSICAYAQDVIVTKDAKKIDAKILEVTKGEIKYKEFDYQDGPTFTLGIEDINSIIYANGKVALYNQDKAKEEQKKYVQTEEEDEELRAWIEESDKQAEARRQTVQAQIAAKEIKQQVIADFEISSKSNPPMYRFINRTSGATDLRWDFGDGSFSFAPDEAIHIYEKAGTYTVTLTANVGGQKYQQRKTLTVGGSIQQEQISQAQMDRLQQQMAESGAKLGQAIGSLIQSENSYALDIQNTTKHPYRINLDGHILGVVNPYKTERFIVSVEIYGRMQAVQTSGYLLSPTIKEYKIPRQLKKTACTVVIK